MTDQPRVRRNDWGSPRRRPPSASGSRRSRCRVVDPGVRRAAAAALRARRPRRPDLPRAPARGGRRRRRPERAAGAARGAPRAHPDRPRRERLGPRERLPHRGARRPTGDVLHWLDADMLVEPDEVEAQLRWHHLIDHAVVLGAQVVRRPRAAAGPRPPHAGGPDARGLRRRGAGAALGRGRLGPHRRPARRRPAARCAPTSARPRRCGATLYDESGGMDTTLRLGEDIDLGYRLARVRRGLRRRPRGPQLAPRPHPPAAAPGRGQRLQPARSSPTGCRTSSRSAAAAGSTTCPTSRSCSTPAAQHHDAVQATRRLGARLLAHRPVGDPARRLVRRSARTGSPPLDDPHKSARLVRATYAARPAGRARRGGRRPRRGQFRMTLRRTPRGRRGPEALATLVLHLERTHHGLRQVMMPDGYLGAGRAHRGVRASGAGSPSPASDLDDDRRRARSESWWVEAGDAGFEPSAEIRRPAAARHRGSRPGPGRVVARARRGRPSRSRRSGPKPPAGRRSAVASVRSCVGAANKVDRHGDSPTPLSEPIPVKRRVVFVVGSGRSGTSTMSGALQTLGMHVPQPEVAADETNPKGFGGAAVGRRLPRRAAEALQRPGLRRPPVGVVRDRQAVGASSRSRGAAARLAGARSSPRAAAELVVKDPRLAWFLGLWRSAALRCDATPAYVTMLRPVTEVVGSKQRYYAARSRLRRGAAHRGLGQHDAAHRARHPRLGARASSGTTTCSPTGRSRVFGSARPSTSTPCSEATANDIRTVHQFIDPDLHRVQLTWDDVAVPPRLREIAEESWQAPRPAGRRRTATPRRCTTRSTSCATAYVELYDEAEALAQSSALAARREGSRSSRRRGAGRARGGRPDAARRARDGAAGARRGLRRALGKER